MSLHKKVVSALLAGALLSSAALSAEKQKTSDPVVQSQPAKPNVQPAPRQAPPKARGTQHTPNDARSVDRPRDKRPDAPSHRVYDPRVPAKPRPPIVTPRVDGQHRPDYDRNRHWDSRNHRDSCRYDPWWQHRWSHWDTPRFSVWVGWPYWSTWGWEDRHAYRAYERSGTVDTFEVMPPLGYERAVVAYFRGTNDDTIRVELERTSPQGGIELVVLRDSGADGDLESAVYTSGRNRDGALTNYQRDGGNLMFKSVADQLYDQVYNDILDEIQDRN